MTRMTDEAGGTCGKQFNYYYGIFLCEMRKTRKSDPSRKQMTSLSRIQSRRAIAVPTVRQITNEKEGKAPVLYNTLY